MSFTPSKYQQAIFDYVQNSTGHLVIEATAGSGKTSTCLESLRYVPLTKRALFLAYNKTIATTLQSRVPAGVKASTIHSQGYGIVKSIYPNAQTDFDKVYTATQEACKNSHWIVPKDERVAFLSRVRKIVDLMRLTLTSEEYEMNEMCVRYSIENEDSEVEYAMEVYRDIVRDNTTFDFTDMIFIPATHDFVFKGFDFVYVDEFQDCCEAQYRFIRKLLRKPGGRLIMVGDRWQSIYGHQGSDPGLFEEALSEPNTIALPLSISYRCPAAVIEHARKLVPHIEPRENAPTGSVVMEGSVRNVRDGDVVLCRTNFPLVCLCMSLLKDGRKAIIRGNDIGKSLVTFLKPWLELGTFEMRQGMEQKHANLIRKLTRKYPDRDLETVQDYQTFTERIQIINALSEDCETVAEVVNKINRIFSDEMGTGIILSTVHRFKGLEADNVFIVQPELIPFPYYIEQPWQIEQERNIDYVARTRAIVKLEYIRDWTCFKKKGPQAKAKGDFSVLEAVQSGREVSPKHFDVTPSEVAVEIAKLRRETFGAVDATDST
jgi:DNA helicase-2/ATP-dependent DNA helicase PcrA